MAVIVTDNFSCGSSKAGIAIPDLRVDIVDEDGAQVGASQTDGVGSCEITELGRGVYLVTFEHPDGHRGAAKLMQVTGTLFLASVAIMPAGAILAAEVAGAVWRIPDRTLSEIPTSPNEPSSPGFTRRRGDSWAILFEYMGDLSAREEIWFTIKRAAAGLDAAALVQVSESGGLLVINGAAPASAGLASITVDEALRTVEVDVDEAATALCPVLMAGYDLQLREAGDVTTPRSGYFEIVADMTRATE